VDRVDSGPSVTKEGMSVVAVELHSREQRLSPPDHCDYAIDRSAAKSSRAGLVGIKPDVAQGHFDDAPLPALWNARGMFETTIQHSRCVFGGESTRTNRF
jgi:hypothetical protein